MRGFSWRGWSTFITLALAAVLLFLAFRGVDWKSMLATLRQARLENLALAWALLSASFFLRGVRWRVLLHTERPVAALTMFWATAAGYLGNSFLPARAGEVLRAVLLARHAATSKSYVLATALTERLLDVVALVLIALASLSFIDGLPPWILTAMAMMAAVGVVGVVGLFAAPRIEGWLVRKFHSLPLPAPLIARLVGLVEQFLLGMRGFSSIGQIASFGWMTVVIWLMDATFAISIGQALGVTLSLPLALLLLAALGMASAAPSTPGYIGIYQFVAVTVLTPFAISQDQALVYIIAFQGVSYATVILWGSLGLWLMGGGRHLLKRVKYVKSQGPTPLDIR